ncbi:DUF1109 domain-containing protein [Sphingomonas abietis]|uniref:DUF1109 domain-containing protein n=1 Tax=Sphingomonas abietis TaxID=3012344 RepID=A0ABY7NSX2_9SPHN|nr:DUF1109 domain-containing protein [Sphingomonas abietis]WBO24050.1 DUF1109 domain-containing protein [Sphingomonas abietis]
MPSERLIEDLAAGLVPVRRRTASRDAMLLALLGAVELGLFLLMGAGRHDIMLAMLLPSFWWKLVSLALLALLGAATALRSFDPAASPRRGLRWIGCLAGLALLIGWAIDAGHGGGGDLARRLDWRHGVYCMFAMAVLSIPMLIGLGLLMRRGAPTDRAGSALAVGLAGAAWGAFVFVFQCPHDDPFYIAIWFGLGCGLVALAGRLLVSLVTRW